jgi:hypothetical protein
MNQVLGFRGDELLVGVCVIVGIIGFVVIVITKVLADHSRKSQRDDMEATLKMEMIQRNMSAEEIERVLAARMDSSRRHPCKHRGRREEAAPVSR